MILYLSHISKSEVYVMKELLEFTFSQQKLDILLVLGIICGVAVLYCFIVGEITKNYSQMDKLWSLLPPVYAWVIAGMGGMDLRLILFAVLVTLWGARLTMNFARKGAYSWKFWTGVEDYRWKIVQGSKFFKYKWTWSLFNLFFISFYQNFVVLLIVLPALAMVGSTTPFGVGDIITLLCFLGFLVLEFIADEQQWKFQETKKKMLKEGKKLEELPAPYNKGFNTTGLWGHARHPNYLGENGQWISLFACSVTVLWPQFGAWSLINPSIVGCVLLLLIFVASTILAENISKSKYPEYKNYQRKCSVYIPLWKYKD